VGALRVNSLILVLAVSFLGSTISHAQGQTDQGVSQKSDPTSSPLVVGAGDLIEVAVFDTPELSGKFRVSENGEISFPLIGVIHVSDLSTTQIEQEIRKSLITGQLVLDPQVSVMIDEYSTQGITVLGAVEKPGVFPPMGGRSLYEVISLAGGLSPLAGMTATISHHGDTTGTDVLIRDEHGKIKGANLPLRPGDTVVIQRADVYYVLGAVTKPGGFVLDQPKITVTEALALAEGFTRSAALGKATIFRQQGNEMVKIDLSLKPILDGKMTDIALEPGDLLYLPDSAGKALLYQGLNGALGSLASASIYAMSNKF